MDYNAQDKQIHIVNLAVCASLQAFEEYSSRSLNCRRDVIAAIRVKLRPYLQEIAEREYAETCMGNVRDKIIKLVLALDKTPGVEDLLSEVVTGDHGMTLHEQAPYGVVLAIYPATNPCATMINNVISMLAAGQFCDQHSQSPLHGNFTVPDGEDQRGYRGSLRHSKPGGNIAGIPQ